MLTTVSLQNCPECGSLSKIIEDLDCYITVCTGQLLSTKKFALGKKVSKESILKAIRLRNILNCRAHNPWYAAAFNTDDIVSIAHKLIYK